MKPVNETKTLRLTVSTVLHFYIGYKKTKLIFQFEPGNGELGNHLGDLSSLRKQMHLFLSFFLTFYSCTRCEVCVTTADVEQV